MNEALSDSLQWRLLWSRNVLNMFSFVPNRDLFFSKQSHPVLVQESSIKIRSRTQQQHSVRPFVCLPVCRANRQTAREIIIHKGQCQNMASTPTWAIRHDAGGAHQWLLESCHRHVQTVGLHIQTLLTGRGWNNDWPANIFRYYTSVVCHRDVQNLRVYLCVYLLFILPI